MSNDPLFPREEGDSSHSAHIGDEKLSFKRPEFIVIDDREAKSQSSYFGPDSSRKPQEAFQTKTDGSSAKSPISLRFICLLGFIFCLVFGLGMLLWSIALTCLATLSLFQNRGLNQGMRSFWKICANTAVAGFGFTLGMISPTLGFGLLAIYFSLASNLVEDDILRNVIRRSFNHF